MKHIFIDTNVVIDLLAKRAPFALDAATLFDMAVRNKIIIYISAVSYNNVYYILRQSLSSETTIKLLDGLSEITEVADVTSAVIKASLKAGFRDYEDAIQYHCALNVPDIEMIVTRNTKDFKKSKLPVLTPAEVLAFISTGNRS